VRNTFDPQWDIFFTALIISRQVSIPQEAYGLVWRSDPALRFHQKYPCKESIFVKITKYLSYRVGTT